MCMAGRERMGNLYFLLSFAVNLKLLLKIKSRDFPGGAVVKNPPASAGDLGSSPGPGISHMQRNS